MSSRFFENQPNEICSHFREKASIGTFLRPKKPQNHSKEGKGEKERARRRKGGDRRKKSNCFTLSFYNSFFGDSFWPKKLLDTKGLFGDNVIKNPARYTTPWIPWCQHQKPQVFLQDQSLQPIFDRICDLVEHTQFPRPANKNKYIRVHHACKCKWFIKMHVH